MLSNIIIEFTEEQVELLQYALTKFNETIKDEESEALLEYIEEEVSKIYSLTPIGEDEQPKADYGLDIEIDVDTFDSTFLANDPLKW